MFLAVIVLSIVVAVPTSISHCMSTRPDLFAQAVERFGTDPRTIGSSREVIIEQIGQPAVTDLFPDWDMAYPLGHKRIATPGKQDWLVIRLRAGVVVETAVVRR